MLNVLIALVFIFERVGDLVVKFDAFLLRFFELYRFVSFFLEDFLCFGVKFEVGFVSLGGWGVVEEEFGFTSCAVNDVVE